MGWGERQRPRAAVVLASLLCLAVGALSSGWAAREVGAVAARSLAEASDELAELHPGDDGEGPSVEELAHLSGASPIDVPRGWIERTAVAAPTARPRPQQPPAPPTLGILVRARAVRAAIARGGRPSGAAVGESGLRPAGLMLSGVTGYGTPLRDGDVLTRVGGTPATSEGRVIAAVSGAIRSGAKAIDGEIWRGGRRIPFVVEIPRGKKKRR